MQGTRLGPYEILQQLGAGGMGEVWLAQDSRLGRKVAVKILPPEFAQDRERLARFEIEARAAAALNHANIAVVHDVGEAGGTHYLVQEYLQGHSLRTLLNAAPLETSRAMALAIEIAEALKVAHGAGIVHRDLKPENVFVTPDGHAKVLDFGLAKLAEHSAPSRGLSQSPTSLGTAAGMVMGTAGYMAPEQARGEAVDARADIFAFGSLLYEMLAGRRAFDGTDVIHVLNQVLREQPLPLAQAAPAASADLQRLVAKCLRKRADERYQGVADLLVDLRAIAAAPAADPGKALPTAASAVAVRPARWSGAAGVAALVALSALGGYAAARLAGGTTQATRPAAADVRLALGGVPIVANIRTSPMALSPDGRTVVFEGVDDGRPQLYRVDLVGGAAEAIPGTEDGASPFFSPDGRWLGFHSPRVAAVMKVSLAGGAPTRLALIAGYLSGASWGPDDVIVFGANSGGLRRVAAGGGDVEMITEIAPGEGIHSAPAHLPGGTHVVFGVSRGQDSELHLLDLRSGQRNALNIAGGSPLYVQAGDGRGYLAYQQGTALVAAPFDARRLQVTGVPVEILGPVGATTDDVTVSLASYSSAGMLLYLPPVVAPPARLVWVTRDGQATPISEAVNRDTYVRMDAAANRIVAVSRDNNELRLLELQSGSSWRIGSDQPGYATLSPDGSLLAYSDALRLHVRAADGSDAPRRLLPEDSVVSVPMSWSPDGSTIYFYRVDPRTLRDIWTYRLADGVAAPLIVTEADERAPMVSPDGHWLAYVSDSGGDWQVYVGDVEAARPPRQVSRAGGGEPMWSADGSELFFRSDDGWFMAASFAAATGMFGEPYRLFEDRFLREAFRNPDYAVGPDGRFLVPERLPGESIDQVRLFIGFADWVAQQVSGRQ